MYVRKGILWLMVGALAVYQALDVWQTRLLVMAGAREVNPLVAWAVDADTGSVVWLAVVKGALVAVLVMGVWLWGRVGMDRRLFLKGGK